MPKQTTDISGNPIAISYTAVGETWTIAKDVEVFGNSAGIFSAFASSRLVNDGEINGGRIGVQWDMAGATGTYSLVNKANGAIGGEAGFYLKNFLGSLHIQNDGEINGSIYGVVTALGSGDVRVDNTGEIYSPQFALFIGATFGAIGPVVNNYGEIDGGSYGVYISGPEGGASPN